MAEPDVTALLNPWVINVAGFVGITVAAGVAYFRNLKRDAPKHTEDLVLTAGTIANMQPVRDAVAELQGIRKSIDAFLQHLKEQDKEERDEAKLTGLINTAITTALKQRRVSSSRKKPPAKR